MKTLITKEQEHEIEELAIEHYDAIIAFGADMYREGVYRGVLKGGIIAIVGACTGILISDVVLAIKKHKNNETDKK